MEVVNAANQDSTLRVPQEMVSSPAEAASLLAFQAGCPPFLPSLSSFSHSLFLFSVPWLQLPVRLNRCGKSGHLGLPPHLLGQVIKADACYGVS